MKIKPFASMLILGALLGTGLQADVGKGQKLYQKKLQKVCGKNGGAFAAAYTQEEWENALEDGIIAEKMQAACGAGESFFGSDSFENKYMQHLYDFAHEYASDSGNVPSC